MKQRIDNYLAAMLKRGNKLELYLNALWFVPLWIILRIISTFKIGAIKSKLNLDNLADLASRTARRFLVMLVLIGIGFSFGITKPLTVDDVPFLFFVSAVLLFPITIAEMIANGLEYLEKKMDEAAQNKKRALS